MTQSEFHQDLWWQRTEVLTPHYRRCLCDATYTKDQTPLFQFVVVSLCSKLYNESTTNRTTVLELRTVTDRHTAIYTIAYFYNALAQRRAVKNTCGFIVPSLAKQEKRRQVPCRSYQTIAMKPTSSRVELTFTHTRTDRRAPALACVAVV